MDFSWAAMQQSWREFWQKLSRPQKIITVAAPLLVASALTVLLLWASRPQYVVLFSKQPVEQASSITAKLDDLKIPYQLADGGSTILVEQKQAAEARLKLAGAGVPQGSKFSFDYLNQMRLGETDADRKLRYILGLQTELQDTLKTLSGVQEARVHIVQPEPSLFTEQAKAATAGVTLQLVPGTNLSDDQVRSIANLLAASVEGLTPDNVTIVDTKGNVLSDVLAKSSNPAHLTGSQFQLQQSVEDNIRKSVQNMLNRVVGSGNTAVAVNAVLDFDQIRIIQQTYGPGAVVSQQNTSETTTSGTAPGAVPGTSANIPSYQSPTGGTSTSSSTKTSSTENRDTDKTQKEQVVSPGAIKRLSVSVVVDANSETVKQIPLDQIKAVVASAAGIDPNRGDQIQVAAFPFDKSDLEQFNKQVQATQARQRLMFYAASGAGALLLLIVGLLRLRAAAKHKRELKQLKLAQEAGANAQTVQEILLAQAQAEAEAQARLEQKKRKSAEEIEKQKIKEAVTIYTRNNPDEVANLIRAWLSEEK